MKRPEKILIFLFMFAAITAASEIKTSSAYHIVDTVYFAQNYSIVVGSYDSGFINSTYVQDLINLTINEVVGSTGFDIRFNFTEVDQNITDLTLRTYCRYEGNPAHEVSFEVWDFINQAWIDIVILPEHILTWHNNTLGLDQQRFIEDGKVWIRCIHHSNGSVGHFMVFDYVALEGNVIYVDWHFRLILLVLGFIIGIGVVYSQQKRK